MVSKSKKYMPEEVTEYVLEELARAKPVFTSVKEIKEQVVVKMNALHLEYLKTHQPDIEVPKSKKDFQLYDAKCYGNAKDKIKVHCTNPGCPFELRFMPKDDHTFYYDVSVRRYHLLPYH